MGFQKLMNMWKVLGRMKNTSLFSEWKLFWAESRVSLLKFSKSCEILIMMWTISNTYGECSGQKNLVWPYMREVKSASINFRRKTLANLKNFRNGPEEVPEVLNEINWSDPFQYKYWLAQNSRRIHGIDTQHSCHNPIERKNGFPAH